MIEHFLEKAVEVLWGWPTVIILLTAGILLTLYFRFVQIWGFRHALRVVRGVYDNAEYEGKLTHRKALLTALCATVGVGHIALVAVAIKNGGPGVIFWIVVVAFLGMATKFTEVSAACMSRVISGDAVLGGPMYYLQKIGAWAKPLPYLYALFGILAAFGAADMVQSNQVSAALKNGYGVPTCVTGIILMILTGIIIIGGVTRIANIASKQVPTLGILYLGTCLTTIAFNYKNLIPTLVEIVQSAFQGTAPVGGFIGATASAALVQGMRRALFASEAGLGTAAMAHCNAKSDEPVREGFVALLEPTYSMLMCVATGLTICITGAWKGNVTGVEMVQLALDTTLPGVGKYFVPIAIAICAFGTVYAWSLYGEQCTRFLVGSKGVLPYRLLYVACVFVGAVWSIQPVMNLADSAIACMALINVPFGLGFLASEIKAQVMAYKVQHITPIHQL